MGFIERDGCSDIITPSIPNAVKNCCVFYAEMNANLPRIFYKTNTVHFEMLLRKVNGANLELTSLLVKQEQAPAFQSLELWNKDWNSSREYFIFKVSDPRIE